jgi:plastocyanin
MLNFEIDKEKNDFFSHLSIPEATSVGGYALHDNRNNLISSAGKKIQEKLKDFQSPFPSTTLSSQVSPSDRIKPAGKGEQNLNNQDLIGLLSDSSNELISLPVAEEKPKGKLSEFWLSLKESSFAVRLILGCVLLLQFILLILCISLLISSSSSSGQINYLESKISTLENELSFLKSVPNPIELNRNVHASGGTSQVTATVHADALQFYVPKEFEIKQAIHTTEKKRIWSAAALKIQVDDSVRWKWETNENIISCDPAGLSLPVDQRTLDSGPLKPSGEYVFTFKNPGMFHYTSENSQSMNALIIVQDRPSAPLAYRTYTGPVNVPPVGIQRNYTLSDLRSVDGCWEECYSAPVNGFSNPSFDRCNGDLLFVAVGPRDNHQLFLQGAFAESNFFAKSLAHGNYGGACSSITVYSDVKYSGVYWYAKRCDVYFTFGFLSNVPYSSSLSLSGGNICSTDECCGSNKGVSIGTRSTCINNRVVQDDSLRKVIYTNTCSLWSVAGESQ